MNALIFCILYARYRQKTEYKQLFQCFLIEKYLFKKKPLSHALIKFSHRGYVVIVDNFYQNNRISFFFLNLNLRYFLIHLEINKILKIFYNLQFLVYIVCYPLSYIFGIFFLQSGFGFHLGLSKSVNFSVWSLPKSPSSLPAESFILAGETIGKIIPPPSL